MTVIKIKDNIIDNEIMNTVFPNIAANIPAVNNVPNLSALSITPIPSSDTPNPSPLALRYDIEYDNTKIVNANNCSKIPLNPNTNPT